MAKKKSLLYISCIAMIICALLWWLGAQPIEGFTASQWPGPPYMSGAVFKELCDYNIDNRYALIPYKGVIQEGESVFMKVRNIQQFLHEPPSVKVRVVISNSDEEFTDSLYTQIQPYVTSVFAINCSAKKAHQIPIGFRDDMYTPHRDLTDILTDSSKPGEKDILCLLNFLIATNPDERQAARDAFIGKSWATIDQEYNKIQFEKTITFTDPDTIQKRLDCYTKLKRAKFVVCPPGAGRDTHRVYETLFFGGIPIIKSSFLDPMYKRLGGCWIVKDWSEVTEDTCKKHWASRVAPQLFLDPSKWLNTALE